MRSRSISSRLTLASFVSIAFSSVLILAGVVWLQYEGVERQVAAYADVALEEARSNLVEVVGLGHALLQAEHGGMVAEIQGTDATTRNFITMLDSGYYYEITFNPTDQQLRDNLFHMLHERFPEAFIFVLNTSGKILGFPGRKELTARFGGKDFRALNAMEGSGLENGARLREVIVEAFKNQEQGVSFTFDWPRGVNSPRETALCHAMYFQPLSWVVGVAKFQADLDRHYLGKALNALALHRGGQDGYLWAVDLDGTMLMHPEHKELVGKDVAEYRDGTGKALFAEVIGIAHDEGQGFVSYRWPRPGNGGREQEKLAFVRLFEPWSVVLGTGLYVEDIQAKAEQGRREYRQAVYQNTLKLAPFVLAVVLLTVLVSSRYILRIVGRPIARLTAFSQRIEQGDLEAEVEPALYTAEVRALKDAQVAMVAALKQNMREAREQGAQAAAQAREAEAAYNRAEEARLRTEKVERYQQREIGALNAVLQRMADGDLTVRYAAGEADADIAEARAGFQELEQAVNTSAANLGQLIEHMQAAFSDLFRSAQKFLKISEQLLAGSEEMSQQANGVAGATEQMSLNVSTMAASTEEMSVNVNTISGTAEEISVTLDHVTRAIQRLDNSIGEISGNAQDGARVAEEARCRAEEASQSMSTLGEAAKDIGKVTGVIKRIAEQTNLLALNATIEAASAGEAGKGFAVVAHEIKELANQSAKAAEDIAERIQGVQRNTVQAVEVISRVTGIITSISNAVRDISRAVEEQAESSREISLSVQETNQGAGGMAMSISEANKGALEMSKNAGEAAKAINDIAENIQGLNKLARIGADSAHEVHEAASRLAELASTLEAFVQRFKV
jgi:methyl-accepting chemotaxis protein